MNNLKKIINFMIICVIAFLAGAILRLFTPPFFEGQCIGSAFEIVEAKIVKNNLFKRESTIHVVLKDGNSGDVIVPFYRLLNDHKVKCKD